MSPPSLFPNAKWNKLHIHERIFTSCSERVSKCVRRCSQHLSNVHTCTYMVLTTPFEMHTTLSAKSAYALVHARICNSAGASLPWMLLRAYLESSASIEHAVVCCPLLPPLLLSGTNPSPDAVSSRNLSKSTLAHDAVDAAVSQSIIRSSVLVQASSTLSMGRTRAWPQSSPIKKIHFRNFSCEFFPFLIFLTLRSIKQRNTQILWRQPKNQL